MTHASALSRKEFADLLGVSPGYITKLGDNGHLVEGEGGILVGDTLRAMRTNLDMRPKLADKVDELLEAYGGADAGEYAVADRIEELLLALQGDDVRAVINATSRGTQLIKAISEARTAFAKADQEEMERDKQAGALIAREDADFVLNDYGATLRGLLENLADRLAPVVYPLKSLEETHAAISEQAEALLQEMVETMRRRAQEMGEKA